MKERSLAWLPIDMELHRLEFMLKCLVGTLCVFEVDGLMVQDERVIRMLSFLFLRECMSGYSLVIPY